MKENFRVDEDNMIQLFDTIEQLNIELTNAHDKFSTLISAIEGSESWKGKSKKIFMVYMKLLEQYHGALASTGTIQPMDEARKALAEYLTNTDTFYAEFIEYKTLEAD